MPTRLYDEEDDDTWDWDEDDEEDDDTWDWDEDDEEDA